MEIENMDKSVGSVSSVRKRIGFVFSILYMVLSNRRNDSSKSKTHLASCTYTP
jgi:hypothetical protein